MLLPDLKKKRRSQLRLWFWTPSRIEGVDIVREVEDGRLEWSVVGKAERKRNNDLKTKNKETKKKKTKLACGVRNVCLQEPM